MFNMLKTSLACLAALFCLSLAAQDRRSVAVPTPIGKTANVTQMNKTVARSALEEYIVNLSYYTVVDRNSTDQLLSEHSFQRDGLVDQTKIVELGKLLNADLVCVISLTKEEGDVNIEAQVIDVKTGVVPNSASEIVDDSNRAIREGVEKLALRLLRVSGSSSASGRSASSASSSGVIIKNSSGDKDIAPVVGERFRTGVYDFKGNFPQTWTTDKLPVLHVKTEKNLVENETVFLLKADTRTSNRNQLSLRVADMTKKPMPDVTRVPISVRQLEYGLYEVKPQFSQATALYVLYMTPKDDSQPLMIFDFAILP
jgi:TolB-like protein